MSESLLKVVKVLCLSGALFGGLLLTHGIYLSYKFSNAEGYFWLAARRIKKFLFAVLAAELVIGLFLYFSVSYWIPGPFPIKLLSATVFGMCLAGFPHLLETKTTPPATNIFQRLRRPLTVILLKYNVAIRQRLAKSISGLRERDAFDCQNGEWIPGLSAKEIRRRIRIIYEIKKIAIAARRRDGNFLRHDNNRNPWEKFYVLVRHMGRDELRRCIIDPPPPPRLGWPGNENRKKAGKKADRAQPDANPSTSRCYDYPELIERVNKGEDFDIKCD